jgi:signal transduction histidine kinase
MGRGDLSVRAPVQGRDEIAELAAQFNQMAEQLQSSFTQLQNERNALQRFIADASHELRTPVTALKNFLTLIQGPAADDPQTREEFLSESQLQVERLEWISGNLLDLSRLDAGLVELEFADHDVGELLEAAANPFRTQAEEANVLLNVLHPDESLSLRCDAPRLEMALSNLLDNALKFTSSGGEVEIGARESAQTIQLWVRDTGIGIHPEELPHIFERFYRGRTHKAPGSGLGLAITKSLVEAQGGSLSVESELGEGARFTLEFQRKE